MKKRPVKIEVDEKHGGYIVRYLDRIKFQRYLAASFCSDYNLEFVRNWVLNNSKLELVNQ